MLLRGAGICLLFLQDPRCPLIFFVFLLSVWLFPKALAARPLTCPMQRLVSIILAFSCASSFWR